MASPQILFDGPVDAPLTVALAHGAGAPMDSPFMAAFAEGLAAEGFRAARFEFPYMVRRRETGTRKPPDRGPVLLDTWSAVIRDLGPENLVIGGKSMGGRMASIIADEAGVRGLVCLGYPFHGPGKPMNHDRVRHLETLGTAALFCQGTRDSLGSAEDVAGYPLSPVLQFNWLEDGDHGFKPRKASGLTEDGNWIGAIQAIVRFLERL